MGNMVFVICKCPMFNITTFNQKELKDNGYYPSSLSEFDYRREDACGVCGSAVYLKTGYSKRQLYGLGCELVANRLRNSLTKEVGSQ